MNEFEILYWHNLMKRYLELSQSSQAVVEWVTHETQVRPFFFKTGMFVKKFLYQQMTIMNTPDYKLQLLKVQIDSIEAYIQTYHYANFREAYDRFDRQEMLLLDPFFRETDKEPDLERYESCCYLFNLKLREMNRFFKLLREPFETDDKSNIIDYNWHVDGILKNS